MLKFFNPLILPRLCTAYPYIYTFYRLFKRDKACRILSKWFISKIENLIILIVDMVVAITVIDPILTRS